MTLIPRFKYFSTENLQLLHVTLSPFLDVFKKPPSGEESAFLPAFPPALLQTMSAEHMREVTSVQFPELSNMERLEPS